MEKNLIDGPSSPGKVGKALGVSRRKIMSFIHTGQLEAENLAGPNTTRPQYHIFPEQLRAFLDLRKTSAAVQGKKITQKKFTRPEILDFPEFI